MARPFEVEHSLLFYYKQEGKSLNCMFLINQSKIDHQSFFKNILSFIGLNKGLHDGDIAAVIIGFTRQLAFTINQGFGVWVRHILHWGTGSNDK